MKIKKKKKKKKLIIYLDVDCGGYEETRKLTNGYIFLFEKIPILWKFKTQK